MYQVIIVDDEPRILEGIIHLFPWNNFGFEVVASFTNGKEALEYINAHPQVDIVMTDIQMPVMNGYEAAQAIRSSTHPQSATIPIIAMTANAFAEDIKNALSAGMNAHIAKPIDPQKLYETLAAYIK